MELNKNVHLQEFELEMPSVYIIYGTVTNFTHNMTVYCKARNDLGESSESIHLYMKRTNYIDVETMPQGNAYKTYNSENIRSNISNNKHNNNKT